MIRPQILEAAPLLPYHRPRSPMTPDDIIERLNAELSRSRQECEDAIRAADEAAEQREDLRGLAQQLLGYVGRYAVAGDPEAEELVELAGEFGMKVESDGAPND